VAEHACAAISNLGWEDANRVKLGAAGACEAVTGAIQAWGKTNQKVAENACGAIAILALKDVKNKTKLLQAGARAAVNEALDNPYKKRVLNALV
jgi:hypothetical protein